MFLAFCTTLVESSTESRDTCVKKASQLRIAKALPAGEAPAFMMIGRDPSYGFGLPRTFFSLMYSPSKSKSSASDQIVLMASIHSCPYS